MFWSWVGNGQAVYPHTMDMFAIGMDTDMIFMTVKDGVGTGYDEIYVASRNKYYGMFHGWQADTIVDGNNQLDLDTGFWAPCFTQTSSSKDTFFCYGDFPFGWEDIWGIHVLFHPAVFPGGGDPGHDRVLVQSSGRLHVSNQSGFDWENAYCEGTEGDWISKGYNEHCTRGLGFLPDGRVISSNGDTGPFLSTTDQLTAWQHILPPYEYWSGPEEDKIACHESNSVQVRPDWRGQGYDAIFINFCDAIQKKWYGKIFRAREMADGSFTWDNISKWMGGDLGTTDYYILLDMEFTDDNTLYVAYLKYDTPFVKGQPRGSVERYGVLKAAYDAGLDQWDWSDFSDGLPDLTIGGGTCFVADLQFSDYAGNKLLAAIARGSGYGGGLYEFDLDAGSQWDVVIPGVVGESEIRDFRALALSSDGSILYAGSRGRSSGIGALVRCSDMTDITFGGWDDVTDNWEVLINDPTIPAPNATNLLGLHENNPYWEFDYTWVPSGEGTRYGEDAYIDERVTHIDCLAVDPRHANVVYIGMMREGFAKTEGLWRYDGYQGTCGNLTTGLLEGMGIDCLAFNPYVEGQLCFGTTGRGFYFNGIVPIDLPDPDEDLQDPPVMGKGEIFGGQGVRGGMVGGQPALRFSLVQSSDVEMEIFDLQGRVVHRMVAKDLPAGAQSLTWNGQNGNGHQAPAGVYFARLRAGNQFRVGEMVLLR